MTFFYASFFFFTSCDSILTPLRVLDSNNILKNKTFSADKNGLVEPSTTLNNLSEMLLMIEKMIPKNEECAVFKYPQDARLASFSGSPLQVAQQNPIYAKILDIQGHPHSAFINTVCFTHHSLGNDFGFYIESLLCAMKSGTNYIAPFFIDPHGALQTFVNQKDFPFFTALPKVVLNREQLPVAQTRKVSDLICKTDMFCWEEDGALMHNNTDVVRYYFRLGMDAYIGSLPPSERIFKLRPNDRYSVQYKGSRVASAIDLQNAGKRERLLTLHSEQSDKNKVTSNSTLAKGFKMKISDYGDSNSAQRALKVVGGNIINSLDAGMERQKSGLVDTWSFPLIPDVAIHYRCGDNTEIAGILPFRAFDRILSSAKPPNIKIKTIYILTEDSARHKTSSPQRKRCHKILSGLHQHVVNTYSKSTVLLLRGHDLFADLARLTYANITICSASTFCLWPAISTSNIAYLPVTKLFRNGKKSDYGERVKWIDDPPQLYFNHRKDDSQIGWDELMTLITKDTNISIAN